MSRYIDADALKETIDREIFRHDTIDHVFQIIDDAPTIEPKRGRWIDCGSYHKCSLCCEIEMEYEGKSNFCPNCGADMREREGE